MPSFRRFFLTVSAVLLMFFILLPGGGSAQDGDAERNDDHAALRELASSITKAINEKDLDKLVSYLATPFVYTASDQTAIISREKFETFYDDLFTVPEAPLKDLHVSVQASSETAFLSDTVGTCHGTAVENYTLTNGDKVSLDARWTATVVKEGDVWKLAAVHVGVNFLENAVLDAVKDRLPRLSIISAIAGLVIGLVIGWSLKKR